MRTLCHNLRNHLSATQGPLERGETLQAQNYLAGLTASPTLHGFGIRGMQEITARYGGTLEARIND